MDLNKPAVKARYARHFAIPEFGLEGQQRLADAKVLVIGAGGLGSPALLYLAAAGVGTLGVVDNDRVDESNLQRQVLFSMSQLGQLKVEMAANRIRDLNPMVQVHTHPEYLHSENALDIFKGYDLVIDGSDNFPTRYLVNDACVLSGLPLVYGSIFRFEGQVSVFNMLEEDGSRGPNYRDLFPEPPPPGSVPNCAEAGVLGVLPGIIGSMQASEAIKIITGIGQPLSGRLFLFDASDFTTRVLRVRTRGDQDIHQLIDYEDFCGMKGQMEVKEITVGQLAKMKDERVDFQLVDVREQHEYELCHLDGLLIPMGELKDRMDEVDSAKTVVVHCRSGKRSADAIRILQEARGLHNLYNLKGGILAWSDEIDPSIPKY